MRVVHRSRAASASHWMRPGRLLPVNSLRDGNSAARAELTGDVCPECWTLMPLTGVCECWES